jgi:SAM-dependent methyltransferase
MSLAEEATTMPGPSSKQVHEAVAKSYGDRVRPILERDEAITLIDVTPASGTASCCDTNADASCCGSETTDDLAISNIAKLYAGSDIDTLPSSVTDAAFGCGNPTAIESLRPGERVLDLGSGGGIDCFLAAKQVGPAGHVIGVDMTPEMVALARKNQAKVGATNVEFRQGTIEALPVEDATVDVIISNCVINLSPDKPQVFREAFRVLAPGGRLQVSDIVWTRPVPEEIRGDMEQWAGCIAGALLAQEYRDAITAAGFEVTRFETTEYPGGKGIASANVVAIKRA